MAAHAFDDLVVAAVVAQHARDDAVLAVHRPLADGDLTPLPVVADDGDDRDVEADESVEVEAVEPERAVAVDHDDALVRVDGVDRHAEASADAERAEGARIVPLPRQVHRQDLRRVRDDVAAVADDDRVVVDEAGDVGAEAERVDRIAVAGHPLFHLRARLVLLLAKAGEPLGVVGLGAGQLGGRCFEEGAGVGLDRDVDVVVAAEFRRVGIDLDQLRLGVEALAVGEAEVYRRADDHDRVGDAQRVAAAAAVEERVVLRDRAAAHPVQVHGRLQCVRERAQLLVRLAPVDRRAGHDQRALGLAQRLGRLREDVRVGVDAALRAVALREPDLGLLDLAEEDVGGDFEEGGPAAAGHRRAKGHRDELRDALGLVDALGELGDRAQEFGVVHVLQRAHLEAGERAAAADDEHRRLVVPGVGDGGDAVGDAGAGGDDGDAALASRARPAFGGVAGDLLVADVDDLDLFVEAGVVDRLHVAAAEREDGVDAFLLDSAGDEVAAVNEGHVGTPSVQWAVDSGWWMGRFVRKCMGMWRGWAREGWGIWEEQAGRKS